MSEPTVDNVAESAKNWIDSLTARNQWRLQILSKRYRVDPDTGEQVPQPVRIRRFAEGCPASGLKAALDYLLSTAPYTGVIFNGQTLDGSYVPTMTRWSRDDQDVVNNLRGRTDGTYTIVQDLIDRTYIDEYEFRSQSSCSSEVMSDYVWDSADIEAIPTGGMGHTYAIQGVSRNEDGTLNYSLVHHHALTQHTPEVTVEDSNLKWASVESWDNVYVHDPNDGHFYDHLGNVLPVPAPGTVGGVEIKVSNVGTNEDCTIRLQVTRERAKPANIRQQSRHTIYQGDHEEDATGALLPLPLAPEASGGVISTHESQLRPDGRFDVKKGQRIERAVPQASVEVRVGFKGRRVTTISKNQATPADTSGIGIGGVVKVERTEGNLYDNTVSLWDRSQPVDAGERCEEDLFSHRDSKTTSGISAIPTDHVTGGTGGRTVSRRTDMDEEGAITQTVETTQERNVEQADEEWSVSIDGVTHRVVHRNRDPLNKGVAPTFALSNIGKTVKNEKTPGGLFTVTIIELDRNSSPLRVSSDCSKTIFEHSDSSATTDPNGTVSDGDHVSEAGGGFTYEKQSRLNSNGSVTVTERKVQEIQASEAQLSFRRTTRGLVKTTVTRNGSTPATDPGATAVGCSRSHERTPGGKYNLTVVELTASTVQDSARCRKTWFEHEHDNVTLDTGSVDTTDVADAGNGVHRVKTSELDNDGFVKTVVRETTEIERSGADVTYRRTSRGLVKTTVDRNTSTPASDPGAGNVGNSQSHTSTEGGRYVLTKVELTASTDPDSAHCEQTWFEHVHDTVTMGRGQVDGTEPAAAGNGVRRSKTSELDNDGFVRTVLRETTELARTQAELTYRRTTRGLITTTVDRSVNTTATDPGESAVGCSRSHRMTQGGLYDFTKVEITASAKPDSAHCSKTKFEHVHDAVTMSTGAVDDTDVADAGSGVHRVKTSELDNDGFVKTVVRTTTEQAQSAAEKSYRRTTRGLVTTTVDRNVTTTAADPGESAVGCSQAHRMNPGGTYDFTKVEVTASAKPDSAHCEKTWFEHVHDTVTMRTGDVDDTDVADAGSGTHRVKTSELDNDGFVKTVVRETTEISRNQAELTYRRTTRGLITTTVDRSVNTTATDPGESAVGCSQTHRMTQGGLYDLTKVEVTASAKPDSAHCSKTMFEHVHDTVTMATGDVDDTDVDDAGSGSHRVKTSELDNDGFVKTVVRTTTEQAREAAEKSYRRTTRGLITTTTDRNVTTTAQDPGESAVGCSQAHRMNPGGTYDFTKVELTASAKPDSAYCSQTLFEHVHDTVTMGTGDIDTGDVEPASGGHHKVKTQELDNDGFIKTVVRDTEELNVQDSTVEYESDHFTKTKRITERNCDATEAEKDFVSADAGTIVRVVVEKTPGDKKNKIETTTEAAYRSWDHEVSLTHQYSKTIWFVNATASEKDSLYSAAESEFSSKLTSWKSGERPPSHYNCSPSVTLNKFGLFDGQFSFTASWHPESAGQDDSLDETFSDLDYEKQSISHSPQYDDGTAYIRTTTIKQKVYTEIGRGKNRLSQLIYGKTGLFGMDYSFDPITKRFHVTYVYWQQTEIHFESRSDGTEDYTGE